MTRVRGRFYSLKWIAGVVAVLFVAYAGVIVVACIQFSRMVDGLPRIDIAGAFAGLEQVIVESELDLDEAADASSAALAGGLLLYGVEHDGYAPESLDELVRRAPDDASITDELAPVLHDAWNTPYAYERTFAADGWRVKVTTLGSDGRRGGEGAAEDCQLLEMRMPIGEAARSLRARSP